MALAGTRTTAALGHFSGYNLRPTAPYTPCSPASSSNSNKRPGATLCWHSFNYRHHAARSHWSMVTQLRAGSDMPGSSNNGGRQHSSSSSGSRRSKPERKARKPGLFEVKVVTPPPQSLGIYALPPTTHNGEQIEIDGQGYVVTSLVLKYKLVKGKYVRDHSRLEVQPTSRYFLNMMLDDLIHATYMGPADQMGHQD